MGLTFSTISQNLLISSKMAFDLEKIDYFRNLLYSKGNEAIKIEKKIDHHSLNSFAPRVQLGWLGRCGTFPHVLQSSSVYGGILIIFVGVGLVRST